MCEPCHKDFTVWQSVLCKCHRINRLFILKRDFHALWIKHCSRGFSWSIKLFLPVIQLRKKKGGNYYYCHCCCCFLAQSFKIPSTILPKPICWTPSWQYSSLWYQILFLFALWQNRDQTHLGEKRIYLTYTSTSWGGGGESQGRN